MSDIMEFSPLWGEWHIKELIGKGTFGAVYRAEKTEYGNTYTSAVKHISIPNDHMSAESLIAEGLVPNEQAVPLYYDTLRDSMITEINFCYTLRGNTNIVSYEDHCIIPKKNGVGYDIFIRMEHLTALTKYMREQPFDESCVIQLGIDICAALEVLDKHRIIHRDIKPANIFVNAVGVYKLGDFWESKVLSGNNAGMTVRGTYTYMSPEISRGDQADIRSDIYSLGIVMYRLLNGNKAPFVPGDAQTAVNAAVVEAANIRRFRGDPLPLPQYCRDQALAEVIMKACAYAPEQRWQNPKQMRKALEALQESLKTGNGAAEKPPEPSAAAPLAGQNISVPVAKKSLKPVIIIVAVLLVLAGAIAIPLVLNSGKKNESQPSEDTGNLSSVSAVSDGSVSSVSSDVSETSVKADSSTVSPSEEPTVQTLTVKTPPQKVRYQVGESFAAEGMTIEAVYSDGTKAAVSLSECTVSGFDSETAGQKTVTVAYGGQTAVLEVTVEEPPTGLDSGSCGEHLTYVLSEDGVLTISGQGAMQDYTLGYVVLENGTVDIQCNHPWQAYAGQIKRTVVEEGVTSIGNYAFYGLEHLTQVVLADSIQRLGESCFRGCQALTSLTLPANAEVLGEDYLVNCTALQSIDVPDTNAHYASVDGVLYTKDKKTLLRCPEAKEGHVDVDSGTVTIGEWSFDNCSKVTEIILPTSVTTIQSFAFSNCRNVEVIFILKNVRTIEQSAFRYWQPAQEIRMLELSQAGSDWSAKWDLDCHANIIWNAENEAMG